jgi:hypothetical protein
VAVDEPLGEALVQGPTACPRLRDALPVLGISEPIRRLAAKVQVRM